MRPRSTKPVASFGSFAAMRFCAARAPSTSPLSSVARPRRSPASPDEAGALGAAFGLATTVSLIGGSFCAGGCAPPHARRTKAGARAQANRFDECAA